jgi:acetylornithine deacetylase
LEQFFTEGNIPTKRLYNNVWATNKHFNDAKPTILLNSHHDTVIANKKYANDPFAPIEKDNRLFGLGSNDAGGSLVSLIAAFLYYYEKENLKYNLVLAASAEEEISGLNGISSVLPLIPGISFGIVGEPTKMNMAIAEKGLLVLDCVANGIPGHAARDEGENAIYKAMQDIEWFKSYTFPKISPLLGPVKMSVTMISAGLQHNIVPGTCNFTVDCRLNECYSNEEFLEIVRKNVSCAITTRSMRLKSTAIAMDHPIVAAGTHLGLEYFGSPTLSDKALMPFPALKIGPGDSARSHMADEFIYLSEIREGIGIYIKLLNEVL